MSVDAYGRRKHGTGGGQSVMGGTLSRSAWLAVVAIGAVSLALPSRGAESTIAFTSNRNGNMDIYVMDPDGGNARTVSRNDAWDWYPTWSPDGKEIAFSSERDGDMEIHALHLSDGRTRRLTRQRDLDYAPAWSPDGSRIAYTRHEGRLSEVHVMDADGANSRPLTDGPAATEPAWSTDGSRIAYSTQDGVRMVGPDGADPVHFVRGMASDPAWSPDGQRVAYRASDDRSPDIYVVDIDGRDPVRLTKHGGLDYEPVWSPDGREIAFTSERDGGANIYVVDVDGRDDPRAITRSGTLDGQPAWARPGASLLAAAAGVAPATWGWLRRRGSN
ncbi:hypothetical protein CMK11_10500 [Candidatus Poribacteria bacterium]|nr:hypothetical protein [Candidatus Poribacteria bacterium]